MKKKKLKKRIETLENELCDMRNQNNTIMRSLRDRISSLDTSVDNNHQSCKSEFGTIKASVREIRNKTNNFDKRISLLEMRTQTDYTKFSNPVPNIDLSKGPDSEV